ncbi:hypothetical protein Tco_0856925 [Tanacetum coccineum]|uniref:EF-hand domain-containing protein n=1 Tax=Tanacetum coccineum TaxID=301880 RepID=A0ABQ5B7U2_9ASTR
MMYYQIIKADGSSNNYKIFSEMLDDFDKQDVVDLYRKLDVNKDGYPSLEVDCWELEASYKLILLVQVCAVQDD